MAYFQEAGQRYQQDPLLLEAIGVWESNLRPGAVNHHRDDTGKIISSDYGVMQINTDNANQHSSSNHLGRVLRLEELSRKYGIL